MTWWKHKQRIEELERCTLAELDAGVDMLAREIAADPEPEAIADLVRRLEEWPGDRAALFAVRLMAELVPFTPTPDEHDGREWAGWRFEQALRERALP